MDNNEVKVLIDTFKGYRDLLGPIQVNLHDFADTYDSLKNEIEKLNSAFGGDIKSNLENIYKNLSNQAEHALDLSSRIDQFIKATNKYASDFSRVVAILEKAGERIAAVNELESQAEAQIGKLDAILEEKKKNYNVKELQRTLENYDANVQKVSEFINKDVAGSLSESSRKIETIKSGNEEISKKIAAEHSDLEKLIIVSSSTNELLKKIVEKEDVNEEYIFDVLDKWAESRKVKIKK